MQEQLKLFDENRVAKVVRLIIYEGPPTWIEATLKKSLPTCLDLPNAKISTITLGSVPKGFELEIKEKPKHSYEDLQEKLREYELELVEYSNIGGGDPEAWDEITENYRKCQKEFLTMLKEVCDAGS